MILDPHEITEDHVKGFLKIKNSLELAYFLTTLVGRRRYERYVFGPGDPYGTIEILVKRSENHIQTCPLEELPSYISHHVTFIKETIHYRLKHGTNS